MGEIFLEEDDEDDDVPLGMIVATSVMQGTNEDGEWGRASRQVLEEYEKNERSFQDANGRQILDLEIIDPESNLQQWLQVHGCM